MSSHRRASSDVADLVIKGVCNEKEVYYRRPKRFSHVNKECKDLPVQDLKLENNKKGQTSFYVPNSIIFPNLSMVDHYGMDSQLGCRKNDLSQNRCSRAPFQVGTGKNNGYFFNKNPSKTNLHVSTTTAPTTPKKASPQNIRAKNPFEISRNELRNISLDNQEETFYKKKLLVDSKKLISGRSTVTKSYHTMIVDPMNSQNNKIYKYKKRKDSFCKTPDTGVSPITSSQKFLRNSFYKNGEQKASYLLKDPRAPFQSTGFQNSTSPNVFNCYKNNQANEYCHNDDVGQKNKPNNINNQSDGFDHNQSMKKRLTICRGSVDSSKSNLVMGNGEIDVDVEMDKMATETKTKLSFRRRLSSYDESPRDLPEGNKTRLSGFSDLNFARKKRHSSEKSFYMHFSAKVDKSTQNKDKVHELELEHKAKKEAQEKLDQLTDFLKKGDWNRLVKPTGVTYKGKEIQVITFNRSTQKYHSQKYTLIPREIPTRVLSEKQCLICSNDFLKRAQERLGLCEKYRYLYNKQGQVIKNVITFPRYEWILLQTNIPDFYGFESKFNNSYEEESIQNLAKKIKKLEKIFEKKLNPNQEGHDLSKKFDASQFSYEELVAMQHKDVIDKMVDNQTNGDDVNKSVERLILKKKVQKNRSYIDNDHNSDGDRSNKSFEFSQEEPKRNIGNEIDIRDSVDYSYVYDSCDDEKSQESEVNDLDNQEVIQESPGDGWVNIKAKEKRESICVRKSAICTEISEKANNQVVAGPSQSFGTLAPKPDSNMENEEPPKDRLEKDKDVNNDYKIRVLKNQPSSEKEQVNIFRGVLDGNVDESLMYISMLTQIYRMDLMQGHKSWFVKIRDKIKNIIKKIDFNKFQDYNRLFGTDGKVKIDKCKKFQRGEVLEKILEKNYPENENKDKTVLGMVDKCIRKGEHHNLHNWKSQKTNIFQQNIM